MDFEKYEHSRVSSLLQKLKKKNYKEHFQFIAVSDWLKKRAEKSDVLKSFNILKIDILIVI